MLKIRQYKNYIDIGVIAKICSLIACGRLLVAEGIFFESLNFDLIYLVSTNCRPEKFLASSYACHKLRHHEQDIGLS